MNLSDSIGATESSCNSCKSALRKVRLLSSTGSTDAWLCSKCNMASEYKKPGIRGSVSIDVISAKHNEVVHTVRDDNVFTDVGRNFIASLISYKAFTQAPGTDEPFDSKRRYDGVRYMMLGKGTQLETNSVSGLSDPVAFNDAGHYLAQIVAPNVLPGTGISAVFQRIFGVHEVSFAGTVDISEVGLFPSGPASNPLDISVSGHPPLAYKAFDPVPNSSDFLFSVKWELKF